MSTLRRSIAALVAAGLAAAPMAALQGPGGHGGASGGAGGTYRGPGDTVPGNPNPTGPTTPGPVNPGGAPGTPSAGPGTPPIGDRPPPAPPPLMFPPPPPNEPATPDGQPPVEDSASWQLWWHYNRWDYLPMDRATSLRATTYGGDLFLGRGQFPQRQAALRASRSDVAQLVQPALLEVLEGGGRAELVAFALQALAKLRDCPAEGPLTFDTAARRYLRDGSQVAVEGALLALGIRGERAWEAPLVSVLHDTAEGRDLVGRSKVGHRQRAFAAYGLALLAEQQPDEGFRLGLYRKLIPLLPDERPEVQAAVLAAIGFTALPGEDPDPNATTAIGLTLADQIETVAAFLTDRGQPALARSQAPSALARLARNGTEEHRQGGIAVLSDLIGPNAGVPTEVRNGAVLALGDLGDAGDTELRAALERVVSGPGADRLTQYFALVSLARIGGRPGSGEEPLAGRDAVRRFLMRQLERSRGMELAWSALALGLLEERAFALGRMPSAESAAALRELLKSSNSADVSGATAIALGLLRDVESTQALLALTKDSGSAVVRGYAALALGMIGAEDALAPLRELLASSSGLPGTLQQVAIGLSLLGDAEAGSVLSTLLVEAPGPEVQASVAAALGWVKDPRPLPLLCKRLREDSNDLSRAWVAVGTGRIADPKERPWNAHLMVGVNYDVALPTLRDPEAGQGALDYP